MAKLTDFIYIADQEKGRSIYVWGAQGELLSTVSRDWVTKKEAKASGTAKEKETWLKDALAMYDKYRTVKDAKAFDCSGYVCWALSQCGAKSKSYDVTAQGLYEACTRLAKTQLKDGDLCFKYSDKKYKMVHVGIYIGGYVIEAKGRAYGVVKYKLNSSWTHFGRLKVNWEDEKVEYVLTRILEKGCIGEDVRALQKKLISLGISVGPKGADADFGSKTKKAVKTYQSKYGLKSDGIVGEKTCKSLGWTWRG